LKDKKYSFKKIITRTCNYRPFRQGNREHKTICLFISRLDARYFYGISSLL